MIPISEKLLQMTAEFEGLNKELLELQEQMLSTKGAEKKALKKQSEELNEIIAAQRALYDELKTKPGDELTEGMDVDEWRAKIDATTTSA